jgi:carbon-monoxide dehydrogenase small subunit
MRARGVRRLHRSIDGQLVRSACYLRQADGRKSTVEGWRQDDRMHPLQEAFWNKHALQCGFCTPGFLMTLLPYLQSNPNPSEGEVREALSGNLCRCTGYQHIVEAVLAAAEEMRSTAA